MGDLYVLNGHIYDIYATRCHAPKMFELPRSSFDGSDGGDVTAVVIASTSPGTFELVIDDVEVHEPPGL
ncbi:MAG TPA: hypothetical protein VNO21_27425 [Polyangiaceae bacterium]|nr:hypothetical protein [Polyangiaceae bacterium]